MIGFAIILHTGIWQLNKSSLCDDRKPPARVSCKKTSHRTVFLPSCAFEGQMGLCPKPHNLLKKVDENFNFIKAVAIF